MFIAKLDSGDIKRQFIFVTKKSQEKYYQEMENLIAQNYYAIAPMSTVNGSFCTSEGQEYVYRGYNDPKNTLSRKMVEPSICKVLS